MYMRRCGNIPPPLLEDNEHGEVEGQGDTDPKATSGDETWSRGKAVPERERRRWLREWAFIMDDKQTLTFDDPRSNFDHSTLCSTILEDIVEVHVPHSELQAL